ncbi:mRNA surveillance protein pelota [Archaeoglobus profundus]|uniref:Protein pelota homolog n=1 Tax=Archaeoglobus profundus (strain DSM 5631 / JCM 9629 / NBRC 100127 / Av18) TaxID=572546 RepID=D2RFN3_ARCPA|nr:mRNA surveillance protein pelota [Archaeoglobus profundus]ADB57108.1 translation factor pelota [Archaeoglobus profundus DSM 5631]
MRIVEESLKGRKGEIKVIPESLDDLWHLKYIIEPKDVVYSWTKRIRESGDKLRSDKEKVTVRLGVEVEKVEFHRFANRLRITGRIVGGVEDSGYHTLSITVGKELSIIKEEWKEEQLKRLREATQKKPEVAIVTIEEGEAVVGVVREWGVEEIFNVRKSYGKDSSERIEFFHEIMRQLENLEFNYLVIAGPGFTKEDFAEFLKEKKPEWKILTCDASSIGVRGFIEVLKRGVLDRIGREIRLKEEAEYVERLLEGIAKGDRVAYGLDEVKKAYEYGAIEVLLVVDEFLREERERWDIDNFLRDVESLGGKVVIVSSEFEPGKMLMSLGGIGALLRFSIEV